MDKDKSTEQGKDVDATSTDAVADQSSGKDVVIDAEVVEPKNDDPTASSEPEPSVPALTPDTPKRRGSFFPMVFGGLVAGGIGYGAAEYLPEYVNGEQVDPLVAVQQSQADLMAEIDTLKASIAEVSDRPTVPDLSETVSSLEATLDANVSELTASMSGVQTTVSQITERLNVLEKRPLTEVVAPGAIEAYQSELDTLQARVAEQLLQIESVARSATSEITAAKERAAELELRAAENARFGAATSAINAISAAISSGGGYQDQLDVLVANTDLTIPEVITANVESGLTTLSQLQDDFPERARNALAAARSSGVDGSEDTGLSAFFKSQLNVRSLEPQQGNSVDAILSRAESTLKGGDLVSAIAELSALPDVSKEPMADWMIAAQTRIDALTAISQLSDTLTSN